MGGGKPVEAESFSHGRAYRVVGYEPPPGVFQPSLYSAIAYSWIVPGSALTFLLNYFRIVSITATRQDEGGRNHYTYPFPLAMGGSAPEQQPEPRSPESPSSPDSLEPRANGSPDSQKCAGSLLTGGPPAPLQ